MKVGSSVVLAYRKIPTELSPDHSQSKIVSRAKYRLTEKFGEMWKFLLPTLLTCALFDPNLAKVSVSRTKMKSERRGRCEFIRVRLFQKHEI